MTAVNALAEGTRRGRARWEFKRRLVRDACQTIAGTATDNAKGVDFWILAECPCHARLTLSSHNAGLPCGFDSDQKATLTIGRVTVGARGTSGTIRTHCHRPLMLHGRIRRVPNLVGKAYRRWPIWRAATVRP